MIKKILFKIIKKSIDLNQERVIFYLIYIYLVLYNKKIPKKTCSYALSFEKSRFDKDVEAIERFTSIEIIKMPLKVSTSLGEYFIPEKLRSQKTYHINSLESDFIAKKNFENFLDKIAPLFQKKLNVESIIVGNFDYWENQEWTKAFNKINIKTYCIYRESYSWDSRIKWIESLYKSYKNKIPEMQICVFGEQSKDWLKNVPALNDSKIYVTGCPRTDFHHFEIQKKKDVDRKLIILFDYYGQNYNDSLSKCSHHEFIFEDNRNKLCLICEQTFYDISAEVTLKFIQLSSKPEFGEYKFIIKTKEDIYSKRLLKDFGENISPESNLQITSSLDFNTILSSSKVIIGSFRSTAIVESFLSSASIVLPNWDDQKNVMIDNYKDLDSLNIFKIKNSNEFEDSIRNILKSSYNLNLDIKNRLSLVEYGLHKLDGNASKRFEKVYLDTLNI